MGLVEITQAHGNIPVTIFKLTDRVNLGNYAVLEEATRNAYNDGMRNLVIDLSETPSMTSIGIRALIVIHKLLGTEQGKHLKLARLRPEIREMLDISGVTQYIEIFETVDDAVASF